jgi:putative lipoic acid-binding regulatory protein
LVAKIVILIGTKKCKVKCIFAAYKFDMSTEQNAEEFYKKLKAQLYDTALWPSEYLYKFIVISDSHKIAIIESLFDNVGAVIHTTESKNGKYTSVSINVSMNNPEAVIAKYKEVAEKVEGVISL